MEIQKINDFEDDDICICEIKMYNRYNKHIFTFEDIHCPKRNYHLKKPKNMKVREFKKVTKIVIKTVKKIGSKAIVN